MYKIYLDQTAFHLVSRQAIDKLPKGKTHLAGEYHGKTALLLNYIDMAEKSERYETVTLIATDVEKLKTDFFSLFKIVEAAGGLVYNQAGEILFIYRRKHWDLPKGKIDKGESKEDAALREVAEETGLQEVERHELLYTSYHVYRNKKDKRCLKPTYWYRMTTEKTALKLQHEEDIEDAKWMTKADFLAADLPTFGSINDVVEIS